MRLVHSLLYRAAASSLPFVTGTDFCFCWLLVAGCWLLIADCYCCSLIAIAGAVAGVQIRTGSAYAPWRA